MSDSKLENFLYKVANLVNSDSDSEPDDSEVEETDNMTNTPPLQNPTISGSAGNTAASVGGT